MTDDGDQVEGYHIYVGGGFGPDAALGREIYRDVKARRCAARQSSACSRAISPIAPSRDETFLAFSRRHEVEHAKEDVRGGAGE